MHTTTTRISRTDCEDSRTTITAVTTTTLREHNLVMDHINEFQDCLHYLVKYSNFHAVPLINANIDCQSLNRMYTSLNDEGFGVMSMMTSANVNHDTHAALSVIAVLDTFENNFENRDVLIERELFEEGGLQKMRIAITTFEEFGLGSTRVIRYDAPITFIEELRS